ncbi:unnamed protein product [Rhodiola kirilowii]
MGHDVNMDWACELELKVPCAALFWDWMLLVGNGLLLLMQKGLLNGPLVAQVNDNCCSNESCLIAICSGSVHRTRFSTPGASN